MFSLLSCFRSYVRESRVKPGRRVKPGTLISPIIFEKIYIVTLNVSMIYRRKMVGVQEVVHIKKII